MNSARALLDSFSLTPDEASLHGIALNRDGKRRSAFELLSLPSASFAILSEIWPVLSAIPAWARIRLETDARYAVYLGRQQASIIAFKKDEAIAIPAWLNPDAVAGLSTEIRQKLRTFRPATLAQASRIDGMTPAALMLLLAHIRKGQRRTAAPKTENEPPATKSL